MKILVTGGAGFIGSHVTDKLLVGNNKVVVIDDFNDYYDPQIKRQNLNQAKDHPNFELIDGDIRDQALISSIFTKNKFDSVIHLAARAGVRPSLSNPKLYWDVNVMGTLNILEAMKDTGVKNLVFAGSSSVYGNRGDGPFNETDNTDQPISPYGASKKAGEVLIATYAHLYGIRTTVLRFFTAYGPRNRPDMAMSLLAKASNTGTPFTMFGDGKTGRDYTYIEDIIGGILKAINSSWQYEIINLGNSKPVSLSDLILLFEQVGGKKLNLVKQEIPAGDVELTFADITKAKQFLDWAPQTGIQTGIENLLKWYSNSIK